MTTCTHMLLAGALVAAAALPAQELPGWAQKIRPDHPRLFFNQDTWPAVRERALGAEKAWYDATKGRVDNLLKEIGSTPLPEPRELGPQAAWAAFVYRMTGEQQYLELAKRALDTSLRFYDLCFEQKRAVDWYSTSRVHATLAWDWLYNDLAAPEREAYLSRLVRALQNVYTARPPIYRESLSRYSTGFYGVTNCRWFVGCTGLGTGIEEELVREWLVWGYEENLRMLEHRRQACGDDGGSASPTLGYALDAYPWSEQNFFYTWLSATGENIAPQWPHSAWLANYVIWNWIETGGRPLEFGYGDTPHTTSLLPIGNLYSHMANIRHLYGRLLPDAAALARHVQEITPSQRFTNTWFIYPFLLTQVEDSPPPLRPERLPHGRHFENMGQVFMRSGLGRDDTYCLFTCGGILSQHRHFDALNVVIYHKGHLALDTGTRYSQFENGQHLVNYYAQTVAHNCVVVHQPGEPLVPYWGGKVEVNHGGQHRALGSVLRAFETNDAYVYAAGDATACYLHGGKALPEKVSEVTRQVVFLMPNHVVVFDRVTAADPAYRKDWLLHTAHEPVIRDGTARADHGQGRMFCRTLFPADAVLTAVGGPGKEFLAGGRNWHLPDTKGLTPEQLAMIGQWRLEVSPGAPRAADRFLHVIQVGSQGIEQMDAIEPIQDADSLGARLRVGAAVWEITFAIEGSLRGRIRCRGGSQPIDAPLATAVTPQVGILATPR